MSDLIGKQVTVKRNQSKLAADKYPGRTGIVIGLHRFQEPEPFLLVKLYATERGCEREEYFFKSLLIFDDEQ